MKTSFYKKSLRRLTAAGLYFIFFSLSLQAVSAQDFSSLDTDLQELENLILDTIANTEEQQKLLEGGRMPASIKKFHTIDKPQVCHWKT
ncbi:MAG: hypothetical protein LBU88_09070 [Treponema sp.]|jgi:hypothetical protein|nr:hypothetical protein [Treponema sp.]